jgi:hypothetical protein
MDRRQTSLHGTQLNLGFLGDASTEDAADAALSALVWATGDSGAERMGALPHPTTIAASAATATMRNMTVPGERCRVPAFSRTTVGKDWRQPRRVSRRATFGRLMRVQPIRNQCAEVARRGRGAEPERPRALNSPGETKGSRRGEGARVRESSTRQRHIGYRSRYMARYRDAATLSSRSRPLREPTRRQLAVGNRHKAASAARSPSRRVLARRRSSSRSRGMSRRRRVAMASPAGRATQPNGVRRRKVEFES